MHRLIRFIALFIIPVSCAFSDPTPVLPEGLVDRDKIFPQVEKLQKGDSIDSILKEFGNPFREEKKESNSRISYLYWPIPQKPQPDGQYPKGVVLLLKNDKLDRWFEWFGDGPT